ncbi:FAD-dependent oxidoreductase, partial [uncultured Bilophila sp.]
MHYDVIIIGGGPGGTTAAKELAAGGKKVALVEDRHWGGTCLNCGCIPTKMLLGATAPLGLLKAQERLRTMKGSIEIDYKALQNRIGRFLKGSSQSLAKSLTAAGITLYEGRGVCTGKGQVAVRTDSGEESLTADTLVLACGSSSASFPGLAPDGDAVLDSTDILNLPEVPESLIIVGAGAIGLELGDFFGAMGTKVTIVEAAPHIAPTEDADIAKEME